jgi:EpsI family protein
MIERRKWLLWGGVVILAAQAAASYALERKPFLPVTPPLSNLPMRLGNWAFTQDGVIEPEVLEMLGPDDALTREFQLAGSATRSSLFVSHYKTQLRAKNAHDPKVCLPGSGWNPRVSRVMDVRLPDGATFPVNYYRIAKGDAEAVVLYWFQTHDQALVYEQQLRAHRVWSAIRENRTDMALVRIVMPVDENGVEVADRRAVELATLVYPEMRPYFPAAEKKD